MNREVLKKYIAIALSLSFLLSVGGAYSYAKAPANLAVLLAGIGPLPTGDHDPFQPESEQKNQAAFLESDGNDLKSGTRSFADLAAIATDDDNRTPCVGTLSFSTGRRNAAIDLSRRDLRLFSGLAPPLA